MNESFNISSKFKDAQDNAHQNAHQNVQQNVERDNTPSEFINVKESLKNAESYCNATLSSVNHSLRSAPYGISFNGEIGDNASGRFSALYDPSKNKSWGGNLRIVTYIEADIDDNNYDNTGSVNNNFVNKMWKFFQNELTKIDADKLTVNINVSNDYYLGDAVNPIKNELKDTVTSTIEIRASWSPKNYELKNDIKVWDKMLFKICNLPYKTSTKLQIDSKR